MKTNKRSKAAIESEDTTIVISPPTVHTPDFNELAQEIHENAMTKGWWDKPRPTEELLQLCISEVAEATESVRNGEPHLHFGKFSPPINQSLSHAKGLIVSVDGTYLLLPSGQMGMHKPDGEAVELADCVIRLLDMAAAYGTKVYPSGASIDTSSNFIYDEVQDPLVVHYRIVRSLCGSTSIGRTINGTICLIQQYFEFKGWDLLKIISQKTEYNKTRAFRHGGKKY